MEDVINFKSRFVDLSALPSDSLQRIAALVQARRANNEAAEEKWKAAQQKKQQELNVAIEKILDDESQAREVIAKSESMYWEHLHALCQEEQADFAESMQRYQKIRELEQLREKKIHLIQQKMFRETFKEFWKSKDPARCRSNTERARETIDDVTEMLSRGYRQSTIPFATDPEECWSRGLAVPPEAECPVEIASPTRGPLVLEPYHRFMARMVANYNSHLATAGTYSVLETVKPSPPKLPERKQVEYMSTPIATYMHNFQYTRIPE
jgi:hypothetical protein